MFSSSLLYTSASSSSPVVVPNYYHHLDQQDQHQLLQESDFQNQSPNPVHDAATDYVLPVGCTITPFDQSKAMNMMPESAEAIPKKIKRKPDNRSKVRTAQGLRDRRVRMSIGIARKFFDLQDLLGFDKPSKTLDWLLSNSNKAISELVSPASSLSTSSDQATAVATRLGNGHKTLPMHTIINEDVQQSCNGALKSIMKQKAALLAKESRVKARARARARTVEKLSTANLNQIKNRVLNNPKDMMSSDIHQTYLGSMPNLMKSVESESQKEEERKTVGDIDHEQHIQNQQLQLQNYDSLNKSYDNWSGLNSNLSLDLWDINSSYPPHHGSSASQLLNLSRDYNITGRRDGWDGQYSHSNYKTL